MDLISILGLYYPAVQAHAVGDPDVYANLVWEAGDPLPSEIEMRQKQIEDARTKRIKALSDHCGFLIVSGFRSSALGAEHIYDSEPVDQLNLVGSYASTTTADNPEGLAEFAVRPVVDGEVQLKEYKVHTRAQLGQVINDGVAFKLAKLQRFNDLRNYLLVTEMTLEQIAAVNWETELPA